MFYYLFIVKIRYNYVMDTERLFNIVLGELTIDKLKLETELETAINSNNESIDIKVKKIKDILSMISIVENSIAKFSNLINNNQKEKEN